MSYHLIDRAVRQNYYPSRRSSLLAVVVHCTAGLEDIDFTNDNSAEATANYAANTTRQVSWHSGSDTDSVVYLLPATYTAWHCVNYNSSTYGHEISKKHMDWSVMDPAWVTRTLEQAATALRPVLAGARIPVRQATKAELDRAIATGGPPVGLLAHSALDPSRRSDPGGNFPWVRFLSMLADPVDPPKPKPGSLLSETETGDLMKRLDRVKRGSDDQQIPGSPVRAVQRLLGFPAEEQDGVFGPGTEAAVRQWCDARDLDYPGEVNADVWYLLCR